MKLNISKPYSFSKVGVNEVVGLKAALSSLMAPIQAHLKETIYWSELDVTASEYVSRDGFIPYSHNCGGVELTVVIPKCEEYDHSYLEFGECEACIGMDSALNKEPIQCGYKGQECAGDSDGYNDAKLRVWLKFEGINTEGEMEFYFYAGGGNGDAPYFRTQHEATLFESSFTVKTLAQLRTVGKKEVAKLIKAIGGAS